MKTTETAQLLKLRLEQVTEQLELITAENETLKSELNFKENILTNAQLTINHWKKIFGLFGKEFTGDQVYFSTFLSAKQQPKRSI